MKTEFLHLVNWDSKTNNIVHVTVDSPTEVGELIEKEIQRMMEQGAEDGTFYIDIPENLSPEEVDQFMNEVKRFLGGYSE